MSNKWVNIILWIIFFQIIGALIGIVTQINMHSWYDNITRSILNPPPILFSIVWPILYVLLAISGSLLWQNRHNTKVKPALYFFIIQIIMNWAWTPLFFQFHWVGFSFFWILIIAFFTLATMLVVKNTMRIVSLLMAPYFLWLVFASYLNGSIWLLN